MQLGGIAAFVGRDHACLSISSIYIPTEPKYLLFIMKRFTMLTYIPNFSINPKATAFVRMLNGPHSFESILESQMTAYFAAV